MSIQHADAGEVVDTAPFGAALAGKQTYAVFKSEDLEVIRLVLQTGKSFPSHKVAGEVTVQCIEGKLEVATGAATSITLHSHQLVLLCAGQAHSLLAHEPSSALVTIALRK